MPTVSVIIATFNAAKTLRKALESIAAQTFNDWECIVVDGASDDNTLEIIHDFASTDVRFRYISEPDRGIYDAFNKGWRTAKGDWIYYLGADDTLIKDAFYKFYSGAITADIVYGNVNFITNRGILHKKSNCDPNSIKIKMPSHQGMIMRRSLIEKMGGFDESYKICADYDLVSRCIQSKAKIKYIDIYVANFNTLGGASSTFYPIYECYRIRKANSSVSTIKNIYTTGKDCIIITLRKVFRGAISLIRRKTIFNSWKSILGI